MQFPESDIFICFVGIDNHELDSYDYEQEEKNYEELNEQQIEKCKRVKDKSHVKVAFLTLGVKGYQINVLKLHPYVKKENFVAELWKSDNRFKKNSIPQKEIIRADIF